MLCVLAVACGIAHAADALPASESALSAQTGAMEQVQKYERAIHVMAMLLVGFGFLMVFVKHYGRSALTATYLLVAAAVPLYFVLNSSGTFGEAEKLDVDRLLLAEFAAASLLICAGAALGRLKMWQYLVLAMLFVPCYMANEWILLKGGMGLVEAGRFVDTGGSIVIHAFGAFFGLGVMMMTTSKKEFAAPVASDATSDRYSLLGSMVLWIFWPSFCSALVSPAEVPHTAINVIFALCGSTLATYFVTVLLRRKISPADIANATLAGGVAIGATCARTDFYMGALVVGVIAGAVSTFGFAVIQPRLQNLVKKVDTCGVLYLHGLPGLVGGVAAAMLLGDRSAQCLGMGIAAGFALVAGLLAGAILCVLGKRNRPYCDKEEIIVEEPEAQAKPEEVSTY